MGFRSVLTPSTGSPLRPTRRIAHYESYNGEHSRGAKPLPPISVLCEYVVLICIRLYSLSYAIALCYARDSFLTFCDVITTCCQRRTALRGVSAQAFRAPLEMSVLRIAAAGQVGRTCVAAPVVSGPPLLRGRGRRIHIHK